MKKNTAHLIATVVIAMSANLFIARAASYTLTVNAGSRAGSWNRFYERSVACDHMYTIISSAYGRNASRALKIAHDSAGFQTVRGHGIFDDDVAVYSEDGSGNAVYTWTNLDRIYDSIIAAGMRPLVEMGFMPNALASARSWINNVWYNGVGGNWNAPKDWNKWKAFIQAFVAHLETRYSQTEVRNWLFELWNEPNWMYGNGGGDNGWLRLYDSTAVAFSSQDAQLKLGGPAENGGTSPSFIPTVIQHCRTANKKLDFVSYHVYSNDINNNCYALLNSYHANIVTQCRNNNFTGLILNTEFGPSYTQGIACHDNNQGASFAAKTIHLINAADTATSPPPYSLGWWAISDIYEETNNTGSSPAFCGCYGLLTRGVSSAPQSWDIPKPAFNAFRLLHKLKNYKVTSGGGTTASPGVNLAATISGGNDTICILVYSHVDNTTGNSATADNVTLNITGIPSAGGTTARMEHWVLDSTHSNSYSAWIDLGRPANPTAAQWTTIANAANLAHYDSVATVSLGGTMGAATYSKTFTQNYYSVGLIQLTNFSATVGSWPSKKFLDLTSGIKAKMARESILITMPFAGRYEVQLFSANGRNVLDRGETGPGENNISLKNVPVGSHMLRCVNGSKSLISRIVITR